ncbi:MAG TPA: hypothetical protein VFO34_08360 [Candidatus Acidoferrales bacterium]|nr:hypothetical protein [Candidatus Acidoferrales bacterium]
MPTENIFANVVNMRTTPTELILEFGSFFPERPSAPPSDYRPEVRVILNIGALEALLNGLKQALGQRQQSQSEKAAPGFVKP